MHVVLFIILIYLHLHVCHKIWWNFPGHVIIWR